MLNQSLKALIFGTLTLSLMGCSKGFQAVGDSALGTSLSNSGQSTTIADPTTGTPLDVAKAWADVVSDVNGTIDGGTNSGLLAIQIDKDRQAIILFLPLPSLVLTSLEGVTIPQMPDASIGLQTMSDGTRAIGVVIPLKYLINGTTFGTYGTLPNGNPVPGMPAGEIHGFAIDFPSKSGYRLHFYLAVNAVALFIETPDMNLPASIADVLPTFPLPIKNAAKTQVNGYIALVPNHGTFSSGVYVASRIPNKAAVLIDELLRY